MATTMRDAYERFQGLFPESPRTLDELRDRIHQADYRYADLDGWNDAGLSDEPGVPSFWGTLEAEWLYGDA